MSGSSSGTHSRESSFPVSFSLAGLRSEDHYNKILPRWRARIRSYILPNIRRETTILADMQQRVRRPILDVYFANTSNLGTHTFFMVMLPIMFWFGWGSILARSLVLVVASGVFVSGFIKDLLCLPRVPSPPMVRLTMSGTHHLEYGFPSTHSTNAVSIATFFLIFLSRYGQELTSKEKLFYRIFILAYAVSIVYGRLYTGMHSITDVVAGTILGFIICFAEVFLHSSIDSIILGDNLLSLFLLCGSVIFLVKVHPEPAENCPCYEDNVAFAGVVLGLFLGSCAFVHTPYTVTLVTRGNVPYSYAYLGLIKSVLRVILGIIIIFVWRMIAKKLLFAILPAIYRWLDQNLFLLPRKFYIPSSSELDKRQTLKRRLTLTPSVINLPMMPTYSIGPQSESDMLEQMSNGVKSENIAQIFVQEPPPRSDIDVAIKLIVYAGIAFHATCTIPIIFEWVNLGARNAFPK